MTLKNSTSAAYEVVVDLREGSPPIRRWPAVEYHLAVCVPEGCAHGFQTVPDDSEPFYQLAELYDSEYAREVRRDDPALTPPN